MIARRILEIAQGVGNEPSTQEAQTLAEMYLATQGPVEQSIDGDVRVCGRGPIHVVRFDDLRGEQVSDQPRYVAKRDS